MKILNLDIETIPLPREEREFCKPKFEDMKFGNIKDPDKKQVKYEEALVSWDEKAALDAMTGQVAIFGFSEKDGVYQSDISDDKTIITNAMDILKTETVITGHNIYNFDLRFIIRRAFIHGIKVPAWLLQEMGRYSSDFIKDTMKLWALGDRQCYVSLDKLAVAFGLTVKDVTASNGEKVTGKDFWKFWEFDKDACIKYNKQDVDVLPELYRRMR